MASSKVMASTSPVNQDLTRHQSFIHSVALSDHNSNLGSMNMDDFLKNNYDDLSPANFPSGGGKTVDEVWKEIVAGTGGENPGGEPEMTLEDFLRKAGAVREEDVVKFTPVPAPAVISEYDVVVDPTLGSVTGVPIQALPQQHMQFRNAIGGAVGTSAGSSGGGRGKRKAVVQEPMVDKATQQKQKRMIKNRESAARSRERKQAYTVELESLVTQLEEENARLLKEEAELNKERFKQLMEKVIPIVEIRRPPRVLRRTTSI